jgi:hypothetical protein
MIEEECYRARCLSLLPLRSLPLRDGHPGRPSADLLRCPSRREPFRESPREILVRALVFA